MSGRPRVLLAGGTGFLGRTVRSELLGAGYDVRVLTRRPEEPFHVGWDGRSQGPWVEELDGAVGVVNLVGEPIAQRWTPEARKRIVQSRVEPSQAIGQAIAAASVPPPVWVNASATGFYGDTADTLKDETSAAGSDFLAEVCVAWEAAAAPTRAETRAVQLRIGFVLGRESGALPLLANLARGFLGGSAGSGEQWVSWIHVADVAGMFRWALEGGLAGPVNAVAPEPVRNSELMSRIRHHVGRPWSPPAPALAMKLVGNLVGMPAELALGSSRVDPRVAREAGYRYRFADLDSALGDLLGSAGTSAPRRM